MEVATTVVPRTRRRDRVIRRIVQPPRAPPLREHAEQFRIGGVVADEEAFAQHAFAAEAEPFEHAARGVVARIDVGLDAVQVQRLQRPVDGERNRFGSDPASPVVGAQRVADFGAAVARVEMEQGGGADDAVVVADDHPVDQVPLRERLDHVADQSLGLAAFAHRRAAPVTHHLGSENNANRSSASSGVGPAQAHPLAAQLREGGQRGEGRGDVDAAGGRHVAWLC